jgi:hypothetical protein
VQVCLRRGVADVRGLASLSGMIDLPRPTRGCPFWEQPAPAMADWRNLRRGSLVTGLEGASLRFCHRGRLLALLFYIAPYKESVCSEDGAGKKGERHPHRKNPSHRNNQPKKYWVASLTLIQAIVVTRTLPANTRSSKRAHRGLFQRANGGGPFRQILANSSINLVARSMGAASSNKASAPSETYANLMSGVRLLAYARLTGTSCS